MIWKIVRGVRMPEMRFTITKKLNKLILEVSDGLGVDKSDYVKSLILHDLKNSGGRKG